MESVSAAQDWLKTLRSEGEFFRDGGYTPVSESTGIFLDALGRPDTCFKQRIIVGGSAGKGSVCRLIEQVLCDRGESVAVLVSPHLQVITERLRINGSLISVDVWASSILEVKRISESIGIAPTFYEANVIANILSAQKSGVEYLVLEVGCGGDFDAVHAVQGSRVAVVTFVGDDHLDIFKTQENIAFAKAGIFDTRDLVMAFSGEKVYQSILQRRSKLPVKWIKGIPSKLNKKLAREVCEFVLGGSNFVMKKVDSPTCWEKIPNNITKKAEVESVVILESAHSASRFEYVMPRLIKESGKKIGVIGLKEGTDINILKKIIPVFDEIIWTTVPVERSSKVLHPAKDLYDHFQIGQYTEDPIKALKMADAMNGKIIVTGSLYLCGAIRDIFYPPEEILWQQTVFPVI